MPYSNEVTQVEIKRGMLGGIQLDFRCPHCQKKLRSERKQIGRVKLCPHCRGDFRVSETVEDQIQDDERRQRAERDRQARREARQREYEKQTAGGYPTLMFSVSMLWFFAGLSTLIGVAVSAMGFITMDVISIATGIALLINAMVMYAAGSAVRLTVETAMKVEVLREVLTELQKTSNPDD